MNVKKNKLIISDKELIEYLIIAQKMLVVAKTELDIENLKHIITALKNNEYEVIHYEQNEGLSLKKDVKLIIGYLDKIQSKKEVSTEESEAFQKYCNNNTLMKLVINKSFDEFFSFLSNNKEITKNELTIIYQYLTKKKAKSIKLDRMIDEIKQHIYTINNFNDMDSRFEEKITD